MANIEIGYPTSNYTLIGTGSTSAAWTSPSGVRTVLGLVIGTDVQGYNANLAAIVGLTPSNDDFLQRKAGAWANRTIAQVRSDLATGTPTGSKFLRDDWTWQTVSGGGGNTFADNVFAIQDNGDATKQLQFEVSGIATGTTRVLTAPNYNGTIATLAGAETFTNKTLTNPVINVGSDAAGDIYYRNSGGALARLPVSTDGKILTLASGLPTWATNAGGSGASTALDNIASVSISASLIPQTTKDLGAAATAWRNLFIYGQGTFGSHSIKFDGSPTGNRVVTFPDASITVASLAGAETLTNKTLTSPIINVTSDATGDIYYRNSGGAFTRLGIGSTGQVLTVASGLPSWAAASGGGSGQAAWTQADMVNNANVGTGDANKAIHIASGGLVYLDVTNSYPVGFRILLYGGGGACLFNGTFSIGLQDGTESTGITSWYITTASAGRNYILEKVKSNYWVVY